MTPIVPVEGRDSQSCGGTRGDGKINFQGVPGIVCFENTIYGVGSVKVKTLWAMERVQEWCFLGLEKYSISRIKCYVSESFPGNPQV